MFSKKSALSSDETVKSTRPRDRIFDQQQAGAYKKERMFQTHLVLNKKNTFILVCGPGQGSYPIKKIAWQLPGFVLIFKLWPTPINAWPPKSTALPPAL